ncbi:MAG: glycosyltransferase family 4 protein [Candidatus Bathyarchaeota archaeon]|jgi:glycosyltransferase involved in cell wall biosynthesis
MRVLVNIFEQLVPISGGGTPRISSIVNALVNRGHEVSVAASFDVDAKDALEVLKCNKVLPLKHVSRLDKNKMTKYLFFHPLNISKVVYEATKMKPDIIINHNSIAGWSGSLTKKVTGCLNVVDMTDLLFEYLPSYEEISGLLRLQTLGEQLENSVIKEADKIITISNAMKNILIQRGAKQENIDVVYDGVNVDVFNYRKHEAKIVRQKHAAEAEHVVMFHGVVDPQDQPEIIVDAAKIVLEDQPHTMFWIIGSGAAIPNLREKARAANIEKHFFFSGWVPYEDMSNYISACDVGLVILPDTLSARIRVTLKSFEYWACEKPIIVAELPALKEIVKEGKTGLFYKPGDPEDLAGKIRLLLDEKRLIKTMGRAGRELVEKNYSWNKLADEFVTICEAML